MFTADQKTALAAPLITANVKAREQGGRKVSYIEGWHVIAEANRVFGFDGWTRETVDLRCVSEKERSIGKTNPQPGWGVSYVAKVRIIVFAGDTLVTREGCGAGHGIDRDLGQAHESALKEAETDAMKRALMTFGNPFGLALYDKSQANVSDGVDESKATYIATVTHTVDNARDATRLGDWWNSEEQKAMRRQLDLSADELATLKTAVTDRIETLKKKAA
jgi:DNA repair and recombination protein RAD52